MKISLQDSDGSQPEFPDDQDLFRISSDDDRGRTEPCMHLSVISDENRIIDTAFYR